MFAIESANIVGYTTTESEKGKMDMSGASFISVGQEGLDISNITMQNDLADGTSYVMTWDAKTRKYSDKAVYTSILFDPETEAELPGGWGDANDWYPIEMTMTPGQGFWFQAASEGVSLQTSGQVDQPSTQYAGRSLSKGKMDLVINPFPLDVNIQDIVMDGDLADGTSFIMTWDAKTRKYSDKAVYTSILFDPETEAELPGGWGDANDWYPVEKTIKAGQAFWTQAASEGVTICFPNPFYTAK